MHEPENKRPGVMHRAGKKPTADWPDANRKQARQSTLVFLQWCRKWFGAAFWAFASFVARRQTKEANDGR